MIDETMTGALQAVRDALGPGWTVSVWCSLGAIVVAFVEAAAIHDAEVG